MSIGIDIGTKTIKIVELEKSGNNFSLKASGVAGYSGKTPEHLVEEAEFAALGGAIEKIANEAKIKGKEVALSLPEPLVFTRTIKFPMLTDQEIESAVKWEAEQYIPIPIEEAILQHQILERREKATPAEVIVLLVAAPRTLVEKYIKAVSAAKLTVTGVETELMALVRALSVPNQTSLIVDFGAGSTDIAISKNGNPVFSRSIPTAGEAFTRAIAQNLGIEVAQAEQYKRSYGLSSAQLEGRIKSALDPILRIVADEIKKAIHYYETEDKGETPKSVILSGGTSGMPDVISTFSNLLNMEVSVGNPFNKVIVDPEAAKKLAPYAPLYSVAVGLALRG